MQITISNSNKILNCVENLKQLTAKMILRLQVMKQKLGFSKKYNQCNIRSLTQEHGFISAIR